MLLLSVLLVLLATTSLISADWTATSRPTTVISELNTFNSKIDSTSRASKYSQMKANVFAFYRGTAHLFWKDLANNPTVTPYSSSYSKIWLSGDAHISNVGAFANDQGTVVYDFNDFDESLIADYQYDIWRMAVSFDVLMRTLNIGSKSDRKAVVQTFVESYLDKIESFSSSSDEKTKVCTSSNTNNDAKSFLHDFLVSAEGDTRAQLLSKYTVVDSGSNKRLFQTSNSDLGPIDATTYSNLKNAIPSYQTTLTGSGASHPSSFFTVKDIKQRLNAGIGSLGTPRYYVLIEGSSSSNGDDVILDVKRQDIPSAGAYMDMTQTNSAASSNQAKRYIAAYKSMGYQVDNLLGYLTLGSAVYSVRERNVNKETFNVDAGKTVVNSVSDFSYLADKYGSILATGHARADVDSGSSSITYDFDKKLYAVINGNHASFESNLASLVSNYADQVVLDYNSFVASYSQLSLVDGTTTTTTDVDTAAVIGGVVAAVFAVVGLGALVVVSRRRRSSKKAMAIEGGVTPFSSASQANPLFTRIVEEQQ